MARRRCWLEIVLGVGLLLPAGCVTLPTAGEPALAPKDLAAKKERELPPALAAKVCLTTARELEDNGHEADAILQYERARQFDPLADVARRLAVLYDRQGQDAKALAEYERVLRAHPNDATVRNDLGYFHYQRRNYAEAERWLREALQKDEKLERAWVNLGMTLGDQERYDECLAAFLHVVRPADAQNNLAVILLRQGKSGEARQACQQALSLDPELRQARAMLAYLDRGTLAGPAPRYEESVRTIQGTRVLETTPTPPPLFNPSRVSGIGRQRFSPDSP